MANQTFREERVASTTSANAAANHRGIREAISMTSSSGLVFGLATYQVEVRESLYHLDQTTVKLIVRHARSFLIYGNDLKTIQFERR
jgi:hypothetical protein